MIAFCQHAKRSEKRGVSMAAASVGEAGSGGVGTTVKQGADTVPEHFQSGVQAALTSVLYAELKRGALQRVSRGGPGADFDALQFAATRMVWDASRTIKPFKWAPLLVLIAEGPERGVQAERAHVDDELSSLESISRMS